MRTKDLLLAVLVTTIWGVSFSVIKVGLEAFPPFLFSALRFGVVALPAVFFISRPRTSWWNVFAVGVFLGTVKFGLLFVALDGYINAGLASLLLQAQVLFTVILSAFLFRESLDKVEVCGGLIAALGFSVFPASASGSTTQAGVLLILLAALSWTVANLVMKRVERSDLLELVVWSSLVPPIPLLILSYLFESSEPLSLVLSAPPLAWWTVLFTGFLSTLAAYAIWGKLLTTYTAAQVTPFALLIPIVAIVVSRLWLGERFAPIEVLGAVLLFVGVAAILAGGRLRLISAARLQPKTKPITNRGDPDAETYPT